MTSLIVGNPSVFALESGMTQAYKQLSQRALGFFTIHVCGVNYGVRAPDATLLACSFDAVERRIVRRGMHCASFGTEVSTGKVVDAVRAARYDNERQKEIFFNMSSNEFSEALVSNEIVWAPDGDEAFDDGSHVLQFDVGDSVRLIAFKNFVRHEDVTPTITEVWIKSDEFYGLLNEWKHRFETEWVAALKQA